VQPWIGDQTQKWWMGLGRGGWKVSGQRRRGVDVRDRDKRVGIRFSSACRTKSLDSYHFSDGLPLSLLFFPFTRACVGAPQLRTSCLSSRISRSGL
jgi:hypothetical protein